jgi:predicted nucleic acid-binding protein
MVKLPNKILPNKILIDASVAIKWVVAEPGSAEAILLLDRRLYAPDLLCPECANILWKKVVRGELRPDEAEVAARTLEAAGIELVAMRPYLAPAAALAIELGHPAYDCIYLAVALQLAITCVTADQGLIQRIRQGDSRFRDRVVALAEVPRAL